MAEPVTDPFSSEFSLSASDHDLVEAYREVGRTVDDLAYTSDFDRLYGLYSKKGHDAPKHEVFRRLLILRKAGLLPRLFRPAQSA
jgi:hypothetical protein